MITLAIETATMALGVCLLEDESLLSQCIINNNYSHSTNIINAIDFCVEKAKVDKKSIDLISVDKGPGSFTALRIGISTARTMAQMQKIPIVGVNSLDVLFFSLPQFVREKYTVVPIIDAKKKKVFASIYHQNIPIQQNLDISPADLIDILNKYEKIILFGEGYLNYQEPFNMSKLDLIPNADIQNTINPFFTGKLGYSDYVQNGGEDYSQITPLYLRKSEAELSLEGNTKK